MKKKATELSLNTIIIAIILLIVLVVIVYLFTKQSGGFGKTLQGLPCTERGYTGNPGICKTAGQPCQDGKYVVYAKGCSPNGGPQQKEGEVGPCCVPLNLT